MTQLLFIETTVRHLLSYQKLIAIKYYLKPKQEKSGNTDFIITQFIREKTLFA